MLIAASISLPAQARGPQVLTATYENTDGEVVDVAAQSDATVSPQSKRMWVAQGRTRAAVRLSDGARIRSENRQFDATGLAMTAELPLALEIDEVNGLLYTLTEEGGLYRESIANPSNPVAVGAPLSLMAHLGAAESLVDMKLWSAPGEEAVVVLTNQRILIVTDDQGQLKVHGSTTETLPLQDTEPLWTPSINKLLVNSLDGLDVGKDRDGRVVAYVTAGMGAYSNGVRPRARALVLCDLDVAHGFATPSFRQSDPFPYGDTYYRFHNPMPCPPPFPWQCPGTLQDYTIYDTDLVQTGTSDYVYLACGRLQQVLTLDVSHAFTQGIAPPVQIPVWSTPDRHLTKVKVDPANPRRVVTLQERGALGVFDTSTGTNHVLANNVYSNGGLRDIAAVALSGKPLTLWTMDYGQCDYVFKTVDVSTNSPTLDRAAFWTFRSDGGVAVAPNSIYMTTFGGVIRYVQNGGVWTADGAHYQPSVPSNPSQHSQYATEHIALARDVELPGDDRLFTSTGLGGFNEFRIDPSTGDPLPPLAIDRPDFTNHPKFPNWTNGDEYYGNDVAFVTVSGQPYVLTDIMNRTRQDAALMAWELDPSIPGWRLVDAAVWITGGPSNVNTDTIHVTNDLSRQFAFVIATNGFFSVRLDGLPTGKLVIGSAHNTNTTGIARKCAGAASSGSRLFVFMSDLFGIPDVARAYVFDFDTVTGAIQFTTPVQVLDSNTIVLPTDHGFGRIHRARFRSLDPASGCGALYAGTDGTLLEFSYRPGIATPLAYAGSWRSDYTHHYQDFHVYDFGAGDQLLAIKDSEGFALVDPGVTCP